MDYMIIRQKIYLDTVLRSKGIVFRKVGSTSNLTIFGSVDEFYRKYSILKITKFCDYVCTAFK